MACPVKPSQVEALIINESDNWCVVLKKLTQAFYLTYKLLKYMFDDDGAIITTSATAQWGTDICSYTQCAPVN